MSISIIATFFWHQQWNTKILNDYIQWFADVQCMDDSRMPRGILKAKVYNIRTMWVIARGGHGPHWTVAPADNVYINVYASYHHEIIF